MTLYVDYMYAAGQSPASIKSFGYAGVMRYLAPLPNPKVMTKAEAASLHAAGLGIGLVWEWTGNRAGAGAAAGTVDAQRAEQQADALGFPSNCPIFYAIDYDTTAAVVLPYFQGINQAHRRPVGVYGPRPDVDYIMRVGLATYGWQAGGWVHGADSQLAHLKQLVGGALIPKTDVNVLLKPFPMWGLTTGDDMPLNADDEAKIATQVNNAVITILRSDEVKAIIADRVWNASLGPNTGIGPATAQRWLTDTRVLAGKTPDATVDVAALAAALAADQAFIDRLAAAVTAQKYTGSMTLEPVQP